MTVPRGLLATALIAASAACAEPPTYGSNGARAIEGLAVDWFAPPVHPGGVLSIEAMLSDTLTPLSKGEGLPLVIASSRGDLERVGLRSLLCPIRAEGGYRHYCLGLVVTMKPGNDVLEIEPRLREWGGRFRLVAPRRQFASVLVIQREDVVSRVKDIETWPGVQSAYFEGRPAFAFGAPQVSLRALLHTTLAVESSPVRVGDGVVQAVPGDTIYLSYRQPSGAMLTVSTIVQPPPTDQCWFFPAPC